MATVVILPDEEDIGPLIAALAEGGHRVIEAFNSGHVLQLAMRRELDVVILPDGAEPVDGEELLPVIRRLTEAVIVIVGDGDETRTTNALFQGADAYLRSPVDAGQLRSRLRALLRPLRGREVTGSEERSATDGPGRSFMEWGG